jgi:hypothetical protein
MCTTLPSAAPNTSTLTSRSTVSLLDQSSASSSPGRVSIPKKKDIVSASHAAARRRARAARASLGCGASTT